MCIRDREYPELELFSNLAVVLGLKNLIRIGR